MNQLVQQSYTLGKVENHFRKFLVETYSHTYIFSDVGADLGEETQSTLLVNNSLHAIKILL